MQGIPGFAANRRLRILVVDDDEQLRLLLRTTFEVIDIAVDEVEDVPSARVAVADRTPDVVVLDVGLPGVDGLTYARELASEHPSVGVVLLTGHSVAAPDAAGVAAVVTKPFSPLDLLAAVHRAAGARYQLVTEAPRMPAADQLLLYADDVRRLLEIERRQRRQLEQSYNETLYALAAALEYRDLPTGEHSTRVQRYAVELTRFFAPDLLEDPSVEFGYLLHDIGKVAIPDEILQKPGPLTFEERVVMQQHTTLGAEILKGVGLLDGHGISVVRHHHERWDGSGYPFGLVRDDIPLPARIFAVADTLDAITSDRPYRAAGTWAAAADEIERGSGEQFDPRVVEAFKRAVPALRAAA
ncbi:MAG TPA: HD domain-containing phosphohydrolase [Gaiellaceae bacterium]